MAAANAGRRAAVVWVMLIVATCCSWEWVRLPGDQRVAGTAVLLIAFLKSRLIGREFMELRSAPRPLLLVFEGWVVAACGGLIGLYWWSP